jgi:hypothetical protein
MKKQFFLGLLALFMVAVSYSQSGTFNSIKVGGSTITGMSGDTTGINQSTTKPLSEAAVKSFVIGRITNSLAAIPSGTTVYRPGLQWEFQTNSRLFDGVASNIAFGNGIYVAIGYNGSTSKVSTSSDGINWTERTVGTSVQLHSICYGNGLFVAVGGYTNGLITSSDGITWTSRTVPNYGNNGIAKVIFGNGVFVALPGINATTNPYQNKILFSSDGITWTEQSLGVNYLTDIAFGNGIFIAVGGNWATTPNSLATSSNGSTWSLQTVPTNSNTLNNIIYGNGIFVGFTRFTKTDNNLFTSVDGVNWTLSNLPYIMPSIGTISYGKGLYLINVAAGTLVSTNLTTWTSPNFNTSGFTILSCIYNQGRFLAITNENIPSTNKKAIFSSEISF